MSALDTFTASIANEKTLDAKLEKLVHGLADRIKAASNDQNIQKLSRDLRAAVPEIVRAVTADAQV